jgi:hypothetical protein
LSESWAYERMIVIRATDEDPGVTEWIELAKKISDLVLEPKKPKFYVQILPDKDAGVERPDSPM